MNRTLSALVTCLVLLMFTMTAQANHIIYTYTTTIPSPGAGSVSGFFETDTSLIADGFIQQGDITDYSFSSTGGSDPEFAPFTWNLGNSPGGSGAFVEFPFTVDPKTGVFVDPVDGIFILTANDDNITRTLIVDATVGPGGANYLITAGSDASDVGVGTFTPTIVPEPSTAVLLTLGVMSGLVYRRIRRRSPVTVRQ